MNSVRNGDNGNIQNRRRDGSALLVALVVVLVGGALIAVMFDMSVNFSRSMTWHQRAYREHLDVTDYIEGAKGWLTATSLAVGVAVHPGTPSTLIAGETRPNIAPGDLRDNNMQEITSVNALVFKDADLSVDRTVSGQRLIMRVYDMNYRYKQLSDALKASADAMMEMPPPLSLLEQTVQAMEVMRNDGNASDPTGYKSSDSEEISAQLFRQYGAYLVRVQLFNLEPDGRQNLARWAEEAFFVFVSGDP